MPLSFGTDLFGRGIFKRSPNDDQVMTSAGSRQIPADQTVDTDTIYTAGTGVDLTGQQFSSDDANIDHDNLNHFDAAKHKAWAASIAENIHADNYTNSQYASGDFTHDDLGGFDVNKHREWAASIGQNIHADNYTDTGDTTYTAGTGVNLAGTEFTSDDGNINHDALNNFNADKHRAWAASIAENVHGDNYTDTQPTKEYWVYGDGELPQFLGDMFIYFIGGALEGAIAFRVPYDFTSITSAEAIIIPDQTNATTNIDINSDYGAIGEAYNNHSESDTASTYNLTQNQIYALDVSGILTGIAAGDYVGIRITAGAGGDTHNFIGFRLRYT